VGERGAVRAGNIFYRNRYEDLFEISFSIFLFLKTDLQRVNKKVNTAINKIIGI